MTSLHSKAYLTDSSLHTKREDCEMYRSHGSGHDLSTSRRFAKSVLVDLSPPGR